MSMQLEVGLVSMQLEVGLMSMQLEVGLMSMQSAGGARHEVEVEQRLEELVL